MTKYAFNPATYAPRTPESVRAVLACPTLSRLLFPARIHTGPKTSIQLRSAMDFDVAQVPKAYYSSDGTLVNIPVDGENGIGFSATIHLREVAGTRFPNTVNLDLTRDHLDAGIVTLADLKALLVEVIPAFKAEEGSVFDLKRPRFPHPSGGTASEPRKYTMNADGRSYPISLEWISYFGPELLALTGRERFDRLRTCAEKYELHDGIVVILQDEPFDRTDPAHRERLARAEAELGLAELVRA